MMHSINAGGQLLDLTTPKVMGILNLTPDSFFDGGKYTEVAAAINHAAILLGEGADILDLGAYSTRSGAEAIDPAREIQRLVPVIKGISKEFPEAILSIDTFRSEVAKEAIREGAHIINDVSGGSLDPLMFQTIADLQVPYVLMHMRGTPKDMSMLTDYQDVTAEVIQFLGKKVAELRALGVRDIILDPGFGFAKTLAQNYEMLSRIQEFHQFGLPILGAVSRKSMIYKKLNIAPQEALNGSTVLHTTLLNKGIQLLRVHDVREAKETIALTAAVSSPY